MVEISGWNFFQGTFCFQLSNVFQFYCHIPFTDEEFLKTHFEALGLEASSPRKLPCLGSRTALFFKSFKFCRLPEKNLCRRCFLEITEKLFENLFFSNRLNKFIKDLVIFIIFSEPLCPTPRKGLFSEGLSLASDFFCVLGLEPCILDSTSVRLSQILSLLRFSPMSIFI